jgi:hypothetical protein
MCRLWGHRPSHRSQLDLSDLQVKTYCSRCGTPMIRLASKWRAETSLGSGAAWIARGRVPKAP